jgi:hypothetical protein
LLVNLTPDALDVRLTDRQGKTIDGYDMLNKEEVKGGGTHLEFKGVRLIGFDK